MVHENDVIIGKTTSIRDDPNGYLYRDSSTTHKNSETCRIDGVWKDRNSDGYPFIKVKVVSERIPEIGDKVSSRHGQKGTCGIILNEEDMPFTASGLRPDLIMNPHAVPSRMTIAHLMETLLSKLGCYVGALGDGTPFGEASVDKIAGFLRDNYGMEPYGNEILYNGFTGRMMETTIFVGPCYYQRLRHCSADKIHSRASGPLVMLTRQPAEGRARDGGLRFGEMERDCVIAHGVAEFQRERFMKCSDGFGCFVCRKCGLIAIANNDDNVWACRGCNNTTEFSSVEIPYASKLFLQELETMCVASRLLTTKRLIEVGETAGVSAPIRKNVKSGTSK